MILIKLSRKRADGLGAFWSLQCDAHCHSSRDPVEACHCICEGAFHGLGEGTEAFKAAIAQHGARLVSKWKDLGVDVTGLEQMLGGELYARQ